MDTPENDLMIENPGFFLMKKFGLYQATPDQARWADLFRAYIVKHPQAVQELTSLMDDPLSVDTIERAVDRLLHVFPAEKYHLLHFFQPLPFVSDFEKEHMRRLEQIAPAIAAEFPGFYQGRNSESFYSHHGLRFMNPCVARYLAGGDFVDCGAYIGDSAVIMHKYHPRKIHAIEPSAACAEKLKINMSKFAPDQDWQEYRYCLGKEPGTVYFDENLEGSSRITGTQGRGVAVPRVTLDDLCADNRIENIRWLKADLEGEAKNMILGARKTIRKFKPLLTLAVYHSPEEFFEIAQLLKELVPEYHFAFRRCAILNIAGLQYLYGEETLIAYIPQQGDPVEWYRNEDPDPGSTTRGSYSVVKSPALYSITL